MRTVFPVHRVFFAVLLGLLACPAFGQIGLQVLGTYATGRFDGSASEISDYDPVTKRLFSVDSVNKSLDILDVSNPSTPTLVLSVSILPYGGNPNSVAVKDGVVAVAVENAVKTNPGVVVFFNTAGAFVSQVSVGALPDMLVFTHNGRRLLVANEGEPNDAYSIDPEGSVSIVDMTGGAANLTNANVRTASFTAFNGTTLDPSIRVFGPRATVAQDLEPEYIAISHDSKTAWVTLQENNAIAIVDIESATVTNLIGLGFKNYSVGPNKLDASDSDGAINIANWPVLGMYQPDAIHTYEVGGKTYLVMANEGDVREYSGFSEAKRVNSLVLDPVAFPNAATLKLNSNLGRLNVTTANGDTDNDGDYDQLYSFGARSFSIRTESGALVYDSAADFELITAAALPARFNASNTNNTFDNRSDDKGPEPEGLVIGKAFGRTYAFIGLERISGVMVYDISNPSAPAFVTYVNNRDFSVTPGPGAGKDLGPEGLAFIRAEDSPNGKPMLVVSNETSGTTTLYEIVKN